MYVDRESREVKYGNRTQSIEHVVGDWGWDLGDEEDGEAEGGGVTLKGEEGAVVRFREEDGGWEVLWEGLEEGEGGGGGIEGGLKVSLERRWVDDDEDAGGGGGEGGKGEGGKEEEEKEEGKLEIRTLNTTTTITTSSSSKGKKPGA